MKTIFWNVDTQYDFMRQDGKLYVEGAEKIEPELERLTLYAESEGIVKVNTADWHNLESKEISADPDFMDTFPAHCIAGSRGTEYIPKTRPKNPYIIGWDEEVFDPTKLKDAKDIVLYKDAFDIFSGNPHAEEVVRTLNPQEAIVYGVATNVCVDFAVMGLLKRGVDVYVPQDAIKELPALPLEETIRKWTENGARLTTVEQIVNGTYRR